MKGGSYEANSNRIVGSTGRSVCGCTTSEAAFADDSIPSRGGTLGIYSSGDRFLVPVAVHRQIRP